ncbi:MAG: mobile mystery protein A [Alphaproteobacteria bacterium]|nr:mobile mystery protein A [Alphaproteobacteria bacterium]
MGPPVSFAAQMRISARRDLDRRLQPRGSAEVRPHSGWLRAIRDALGMTAAQLGARLGITPTSVFEMERREADGTVTLKTLEKAAEALGCKLVYALVPDESLEATVQRRARKLAVRQLAREEELPPEESRARLERRIAEIIHTRPRSLWTEK